MKRVIKIKIAFLFLAFLTGQLTFAQTTSSSQEATYNPVSTAVPFLTIMPDSRHSAMGDAGAATSPDANSQFLNPSQYAFVEGKFGLGLSYSPMMRQLVDDIYLAYLSGFYRIDSHQVIGSLLRYYSLGEININSQDHVKMATTKPGEYALDVSYSRKLSSHFSGGVTLRYIHSDLTGGIGGSQAGSESYNAGNAFSTDVSFYYTSGYERGPDETTAPKAFSAGINLSNIGSKISYDQGTNKEFLPANLRIGVNYFIPLNERNTFSWAVDINKLMVPTPSYQTTSGTSGSVITRTSTNNTPVISSIFSSFTDAPGGMKEELQECTFSTGIEYWYINRFALRGGYFNEARNKGDRKYFTTGIGVKMDVFSLDCSYAISVSRFSPISNTIKFTLLFNIDSFSSKSRTPGIANPRDGTVPMANY